VPSGPFFGFNRPHANVSRRKIWSWWQQGMQSGSKNAYDSIKAFSETDFTQDLQLIDIPALVLHGDDDQVVPVDVSAKKTTKLLKDGTLEEIRNGPHALPTINVDEVNQELPAFLKQA
jgi:non-heme chloroperoxidase